MKYFNIVYKVNSIQNIINTNSKLIEKVYIFKKNSKTLNLIDICKKKKIKTYYIKKINQNELNYIKHSYNAIAKIKKIKHPNLNDILNIKNKNLKILILDRVQDPHNLASCIRTSEAFSINLIILSKKNTAKISSLVHSLSNGASLLLPIIEENKIKNSIIKLKNNNIKIIGLSAKGENEIKEQIVSSSIAILMGSEKNGIQKELKKECDEILKIKMNSNNKSINLSVATGIILSKIKDEKHYKTIINC
ncbi:MAG TPA: 23S rRNA (guanosine(2251)-2'-O)-methyltransferase RlmB [Candidatus Azoamicus sp. MARI]